MRFVQVNDIASVASELAAALRKRGHEVDLLYPRLYGANLQPPAKLAMAPLRFIDWLRLAWKLRRGHYDAVHIHYGYLGIVGLLAGVPYILHCHGDDVRDVSRRIWAPVIKLAIRRASHVYYSTPDLRDELAAIRPDCEFMPNPIDTTTFAANPLPGDPDDVMVACALSDNKGVANLLESFRILSGACPGLMIHALAGGTASDEADGMPNVLLLMHQPRAKLPALLARHRIIIGQVHQGAVGMVELEALACGRPVVSWFTYQEFYPEPAPFVQAHTGPEIAAAVQRLLDNPAECDRIGKASRAWVERYHNADAIAARLEARAVGPR